MVHLQPSDLRCRFAAVLQVLCTASASASASCEAANQPLSISTQVGVGLGRGQGCNPCRVVQQADEMQ
jgi:hypothetical protein